MHVTSDRGVQKKSDCLSGKRILFAVSGGIAAVESVKLARELRRHGAEVFGMMTQSSQKVITPLAFSWGSGAEILSEWDSGMAQLGKFDGILIAPATRNTISKHIHGIIDSPVMMALSAARGNGSPMLFVPSMHNDLFHDPVTEDLISQLESTTTKVLTSRTSEDRIKQPNHRLIVAELSNLIHKGSPNRKRIAVTLGSTKGQIDRIRSIQNTSSGRTGWDLSEHLHMLGHDVICISGHTSVEPCFPLPDVSVAVSPDEMLSCCLDLANSDTPPDVWIHSAAVLDYCPVPEKGKKNSGEEKWEITLNPTKKHIQELSKLTSDCFRVSFKLGVNISEKELINSAMEQFSNYGVDAVFANLLSEASDIELPRGRIVLPSGEVINVQDNQELCQIIGSLLENNGLSQANN